MNKKFLITLSLILSTSVFSLSSPNESTASETDLLVYKSSTCRCCNAWIVHMKNNGFNNVTTKDVTNLGDIKKQYKIEDEYRSCHTAVSSDGYIFEGHIPSEYITQFLTEKPANALGLSVPGMPHGSPGMEVGNHFMPYEVLVLYKDGTSKVYAQVNR